MNIKKIMAMALSMTMAAGILGSCGGSDDDSGSGKSGGSGSASADGKIMKQISDIDTASLKGKTITLYTHGGNRVLGEEKKDADGNTYRDESYAYLKHLAEKFEQEYEIHVDLQVNSTEDDIKPLLQTQDPSIDIYT
ncbi:MAG: ABC transporter substrate-binding protein, partial [Ruminococcus sp.]|nr:ABC transporter substrate-binding protein [Ruminococcus sp.]